MGSFPETYNDLLALLGLAQAQENLQKLTEMKFNAKVVVVYVACSVGLFWVGKSLFMFVSLR